jgi:hypothetical protein
MWYLGDIDRGEIPTIRLSFSNERRKVREQFTKAAGVVLGSNLDAVDPQQLDAPAD